MSNSEVDAAAATPTAGGSAAPATPTARGSAAPPATTSFASRPGAVGDPPLHYGNPIGEQRALAVGRAIVDLSDRAVLTLTGQDRLTWLDSLTSQSVAKLQPGQSAETLLLDPSGRVEHAIRVLDDGRTTYLLLDAAPVAPASTALAEPATPSAVAEPATPSAVAEPAASPANVGARPSPAPNTTGDPDALQAFLSRMVFTLRVEVGRVDLRTVGVFAAADGQPELAVPAAAPHGVPLVWRDPWGSGVTAGGWQYSAPVEHPASTWTYREVLVDPDADLAALPTAGTLALEALRIAAWRPRIGDADERTIPHELDWLRSAVHLAKGCYRGQETVAKVHNLGHPPRRLVMLHLDGSDGVLPAPGSAVLLVPAPADAEARFTTAQEPATVDAGAQLTTVGTVTAAALHHDLGPIALAVIKRTVDPGAALVVRPEDDAAMLIPAAQELIVPPDAGAEANVPRLPRLGAVTR